MSDADVEFKFAADLEEIKKRLEEIEAASHSWAEKIKQAIANAFAFEIVEGFKHALESAFETVKDFFQESIEAAKEHELVFKRLELSIEHVRGGFAYSAETVKEWAEELENATGVGHEGIERVAASLARFHVSGETFKQAVLASLNVAAETGGSAEGQASKIGRALAGLEQGQGGAVRRLREELADLTEQEKNYITELAKSGKGHEAVKLVVDELNRKYKDAAEIIGNTLHGQMEKLHAIIHRVYEAIGDGLLPYIKAMMPVFQGLAAYAEILAKKLGEVFKNFAESQTGKSAMKAIREEIEVLIGYIIAFFERLPNYLQQAWAHLQKLFAQVRVELDQMIAGLPDYLGGDAKVAAQGRLGNLDPAKQEEADRLKHDLNVATVKDPATYLGVAGGLLGHSDEYKQAKMKYDDFVAANLKGKDYQDVMSADKELEGLKKSLKPFGEQAAEATKAVRDALKNLSKHTAEHKMEIEQFWSAIKHAPGNAIEKVKEQLSSRKFAAAFSAGKTEGLDKIDKEIDDLETRIKEHFHGAKPDAIAGAGESQQVFAMRKGQEEQIAEMKERRAALKGIVDHESHAAMAKPFKSAIETADSVFKRIQVSAASDEDKDVQKKQLTELGKIAESEMKQVDHQLEQHKLHIRLHAVLSDLHTDITKGAKAGK